MSKRTIQEALEHAKQQKKYPLREARDLITDFILLADEITRLRSYTCKHPDNDLNVAFVSTKIANAVFADKMEFNGTPVVIDPAMRAVDGIHFPQPDGTCIHAAI